MQIGSPIGLPETYSSRRGIQNQGARGVSIFQALDTDEQKNEKTNRPVNSVKDKRRHTDYYSKPEQERQFPVSPTKRGGPAGQRAIDFYNITAAIGNYSGEGELIGVDTYA